LARPCPHRRPAFPEPLQRRDEGSVRPPASTGQRHDPAGASRCRMPRSCRRELARCAVGPRRVDPWTPRTATCWRRSGVGLDSNFGDGLSASFDHRGIPPHGASVAPVATRSNRPRTYLAREQSRFDVTAARGGGGAPRRFYEQSYTIGRTCGPSGEPGPVRGRTAKLKRDCFWDTVP
jgi:hypothetical protein